MPKLISVDQKHLKKHQKFLKVLHSANPKRKRFILDNIPNAGIKAIKILFKNILNGKIPLKKTHISKLKRHRKFIRGVSSSNITNARSLVKQKGGSFNLSSILGTVLPLLPMIL